MCACLLSWLLDETPIRQVLKQPKKGKVESENDVCNQQQKRQLMGKGDHIRYAIETHNKGKGKRGNIIKK